MIIWKTENWRVVQHPFLEYYHIQKWMEGDCRRSYGRVFDFFTVKECRSIKEVQAYLVAELGDNFNHA